MRQLKARSEAGSHHLGHTVDVRLNVYAQSPVAGSAVVVNELEILVQWCVKLIIVARANSRAFGKYR
jgi:hypothetical protein